VRTNIITRDYNSSYYIVAQIKLGLNNLYYYAIDYILGTMFLDYYLLFIFIQYLSKIDVGYISVIKILIKNLFFFSIDSENNNKPVIMMNYTNIQSVENCKGFSETIC